MPTSLERFDLTGMLRCGVLVRQATDSATTVEAAAHAVCEALRGAFTGGARGEPECALVRCYKTHRYGALPDELARFADRLLAPGVTPWPDLRCLTLLGTAGDQPAWNDRRSSRGHQAIPLPSEQFVEQAPMIAQLIRQFGLDIADVVRPAPEVAPDALGKSYNVFHVEEARGSPYIPAQRDFVERYGIRSVVGFGGSLPTGDVFAVILFARVPIAREAADRFRTLALDVKGVMLRFPESAVFARDA